MIKSSLQFDDVGVVQAFSRFSGRFKGHLCSQESRAGDGLGTRLTLQTVMYYNCQYLHNLVHPNYNTLHKQPPTNAQPVLKSSQDSRTSCQSCPASSVTEQPLAGQFSHCTCPTVYTKNKFLSVIRSNLLSECITRLVENSSKI